MSVRGNVEILRDFSGTINSIYGDSDNELVVKIVNAYAYTKKICDLHKEEWIGRKATDEDVVEFCRSMISNVMEDIFHTGMFVQTKEFMTGVLHGYKNDDNISDENLQDFIDVYYGDLADELELSEDEIMDHLADFMNE